MDMYEDSDFLLQARNSASKWAKELLARDPNTWVILDTETTGLDHDDEVIQIGVINSAGDVLIDNLLVKPTCEISPIAESIHGIAAEMVSGAPLFLEVVPRLVEVVKGKHLVIYNAAYDLRILSQSDRKFGWNIERVVDGVSCAMLKYAEWYGDWNDYHGSFRWQRLPSGDHSALGDCRAVLELIKRMAGE